MLLTTAQRSPQKHWPGCPGAINPTPLNLEQVAVIIPARDEAETIGAVLQSLQRQGLSHIRVIDNGSRDATAQVASRAGATVRHEPIPGYGQACWQGLQDLGPEVEWILFCDADGSDDLNQLPEFFQAAPETDLVLGNRRATAAGRQALTTTQNFGNWLATRLIALGWGYHYEDLGPLRLIRRSALDAIAMGDRGFGWTVEMQARAAELGLRFTELPVHYRDRQGGKSKISGTLKGSFQAGVIILSTLFALYGKRFFTSGKIFRNP